MALSGPTVSWVEIVDNSSPSTSSWEIDGSQATMVIDLPNWSDQAQAIRDILGYATRTGPGKMHRELPWQHPLYPWLYAVKVPQVVGLSPTGQAIGQSGCQVASYQKARLTILFQSLPYDVLSDDQITVNGTPDESQRWVKKEQETTVDLLTLDQGSFTFVTGQSPAGVAGTSFPQGPSMYVAKTDLIWTWFQIPENCLFDSNGILNSNILNAVGKVNNATWEGFPAGTLLLMPPKISIYNAPVSPSLMGLNPYTNPPRTYDVQFTFKYFNPPQDPSYTTYYGHNLMPTKNQSYWGYWYLATKDGTTSGKQLYPSGDFSQLFVTL